MKITFNLTGRAQKDDILNIDGHIYIVDRCKKTKTGFKVEATIFSPEQLHRVGNIHELQKYLAKHELPTS